MDTWQVLPGTSLCGGPHYYEPLVRRKAQNVCDGRHTRCTASLSSEGLPPPCRISHQWEGFLKSGQGSCSHGTYLVGVEAEQVEPKAGFEQSSEGWGGGAVDRKQVVLLGNSTLVVGDHEVIVGHGDGQPVQDGGGEAPCGQGGIVRGREVQLGWSGEVG